MNIRDLKYLIALAEHRHFGKAAEACFVSQPALSMQIKKLEETLGVTLLERSNKVVLFTEVGKQITDHAKSILNQVDELYEIANTAKDPYSGKIKLGIFPTLAPYLLPVIMPELSKQFPNLSFYLVEEKTETLIQQLYKGDIHAAFLALPVQDSRFVSTPLFEEPFHLAVPNHHPLAQLKKVTQKDLIDQQLLLLEEGHCLRQQALTVCQYLNAHESHDFRATSLETLRHMVASGAGITLIPELACTPSKHIKYIPFTEPSPRRQIGLVNRSRSAKCALLDEIHRCVQQSLSRQNGSPIKLTALSSVA